VKNDILNFTADAPKSKVPPQHSHESKTLSEVFLSVLLRKSTASKRCHLTSVTYSDPIDVLYNYSKNYRLLPYHTPEEKQVSMKQSCEEKLYQHLRPFMFCTSKELFCL